MLLEDNYKNDDKVRRKAYNINNPEQAEGAAQGIEELIERFFEGQTSNEEERELYDFFSSENVPDFLLQYRQVFAYFESEIKEEDAISKLFLNANNTNSRKYYIVDKNKKIKILASIAASLLLLISFGIYHFAREKEFNPYEGSYIIRNGVKITDPKIVNPEIKKTMLLVQQQEKEFDLLVKSLQKIDLEDPYEQALKEIKREQLEWVEQVEDESIRNEILEILNL